MQNLILYHYDLSPFSEKARLMLGYAGLPWHSVTVEPMPPRPEMDIIAGGYRKIPVAQTGADVFCDTKTIATEIARLAGKPEMAVENCPADVQEFVRKSDLDVFIAMFAISGGAVLKTLIRGSGVWNTLRFIKDRGAIFRKAKLKPVSGKQAKALINAHLADMEAMLGQQDFLFADHPCAADFSAYLDLWTATNLCGKSWLDDRPVINVWYERMRAFGHGTPETMTSDQALDVARNAEPAPVAGAMSARPVRIEPADYARDATAGLLAGETEHAWVLKREHPRIGTVHVHFPRSGYSLKEAP